MGWYEEMLEKPRSYRKKVAYFVAAIFGFFFFAIWIILTSQSIKKTFQEQTWKDSPYQVGSPRNESTPAAQQNEINR